ncbi:MAG: hypothetical protein ACLGXA_22095 [Acidobacteriota bacterium]
MLAPKEVLILLWVALLAAAHCLALFDLGKVPDDPRTPARMAAADEEGPKSSLAEPGPVRWQTWVGLGVAACLPSLVADGIVVIPRGRPANSARRRRAQEGAGDHLGGRTWPPRWSV